MIVGQQYSILYTQLTDETVIPQRIYVSGSACAHANNCSSAPKRATNCSPNGIPFSARPVGTVMAGNPACVQGKFKLGSPVACIPSGAGPVAAGQIHKPMPALPISSCNSLRSERQCARAAANSV